MTRKRSVATDFDRFLKSVGKRIGQSIFVRKMRPTLRTDRRYCEAWSRADPRGKPRRFLTPTESAQLACCGDRPEHSGHQLPRFCGP